MEREIRMFLRFSTYYISIPRDRKLLHCLSEYTTLKKNGQPTFHVTDFSSEVYKVVIEIVSMSVIILAVRQRKNEYER